MDVAAAETARKVGAIIDAAGCNAVERGHRLAAERRQKGASRAAVEESMWLNAGRNLGRMIGSGNHSSWQRVERERLGRPVSKVQVADGSSYDTRAIGSKKDHRCKTNRLHLPAGSVAAAAVAMENSIPVPPTNPRIRAVAATARPLSVVAAISSCAAPPPFVDEPPFTRPSSAPARPSPSGRLLTFQGESAVARAHCTPPRRPGSVSLKSPSGQPTAECPRKLSPPKRTNKASSRATLYPDGKPSPKPKAKKRKGLPKTDDSEDRLLLDEDYNVLTRAGGAGSHLHEENLAHSMFEQVSQLSMKGSGIVETIDVDNNSSSSAPKDAKAAKRFFLMSKEKEVTFDVIYNLLKARPGASPRQVCTAIDDAFQRFGM